MISNRSASQRTDTLDDASRAASGRHSRPLIVAHDRSTANMKDKCEFRRATSCAAGPVTVIVRQRRWPSASCIESPFDQHDLLNPAEAFGNEDRALADVCDLLENVLRSPQDLLHGCRFSSCALFSTSTCRHHHHRLQAAISSLDSKPVACTGSSLWL